MHRDVEVAILDIDDFGHITNLEKLLYPEHLPIGTWVEGSLDTDELNSWWISRSIPTSRSGIRHLLESLTINNPAALLTKSMGLSLSDQYWVRPEGSGLEWRDVNFFDNPFSEDVGNILFGRPVSGMLDLSSPDNTSDGILRKRWAVSEGTRVLIKSGNEPYLQEPFNEVAATKIMDRQGIDNARYSLTWIDNIPCSVCPDFIDGRTELVTASRLLAGYGTWNASYRDEYEKICNDLCVDISGSMARMDLVDHIMINRDRHLGNYGLIRDAETLEWLGPAPIYDTGTSLMCNRSTNQITRATRSINDDLNLSYARDW